MQLAAPNNVNPVLFVVLAIMLVFTLLMVAVLSRHFKLWTQAYFAQAPVSFVELIGMSLRKVDPKRIVVNLVRAVQGGATVTSRLLERHLLAGGNVENVVSALVMARQKNVDLDFERLAAMDLAGQDVVAHVRSTLAAGPPAAAPIGPGLIGLSARANEPILPPACVEVGGRALPALAERDVVEAGEEVEIVGVAQHVVVRRKLPGLGDFAGDRVGFSPPVD